ncbi:helix-turn-helix transcriptional regulator [Myxococcus sp. CA051A]|uniref:Helix-turn-helix transcriptional regulator n=1 Tax=Myxococcus llanfairpwllgwyngyllgogerychwyrndrobwllllantysiliogogogochensis TaxID=2590453 RepID=A0A540WN42_9BACT|nr:MULTISPECIES: helix-turn-helix transcriptional regulator [Myxococcus]NTX08877.1 helix-turn-helix transcriptional regulator [Myxococcus sp. CA040A]NTX17672.1 helix-turn-helix transcriptional regulator [Myxococcus sp. CA056]NTX40793.1 helix-turn-helix transcriptional regulator [Myxococcus sp. CA033]NTX56204.1 helix-turn-helix transcriptional regulator [Myxococcus sp. CA039A]NTX63489.1 helix-turn-helix transcriptional regulator [Myxococcus sp. CA051A]
MNQELAITVGAAARAARARLGLTQADVAERVGIAMEVYSRMERGRVLPSVTTLRRLCLVLRMDANALLGLAEGLPVAPGPSVATRSEDPPALRRLVRALRALGPDELRAVVQLVHGALGLLRR